MAGIDTVTTFFDQLDNMEAEFRLHNLGYLVRILQIECHIRIFMGAGNDFFHPQISRQFLLGFSLRRQGEKIP